MLHDQVALFVCPRCRGAVGNDGVKAREREDLTGNFTVCKKCKSNICRTALISKARENKCLEFKTKELKGLNIELIQWLRDMASDSAEALNKGVLLFLFKCKIAIDFSPTTGLDSHNWNGGDSCSAVCKAVQ